MLYGAVLAGGESSRMGRDKKHLVIQGESFLGKALTVLTSAGAKCILLSGVDESDSYAFSSIPVTAFCVPDVEGFPRAGGPPKALFSVLEWLAARDGQQEQVLVVIPVDMPLLTDAALSPLIAAVTEKDCEAAVYKGEVFPLVLRAGKRCHDVLKQGLEREARQYTQQSTGGAAEPTDRAPRFSLKTILATLETVYIDPEKAGINDVRQFMNVNTPQELQACQADSKNDKQN